MDILRKSVSAEKPRLTLRPLDQSTGSVPAGSLLVSDVFTSSESHGVDVAKAAWSAGFQGPIFYQQAVSEPLPPLREHQQALLELGKPALSREAVSCALQKFVVGPPLHMLMSATDEVNRAAQGGANNSVLNLSSGTCKAQVASLLYQQALRGENGPALVSNLANHFHIDLDKIGQGDLEELARFQQSVIDHVSQTWDQEPRILEHKQEFQQAVRHFESGHNSVVIAAGNEGLIEPTMEMQSRADLQVPADFEENVLESPEATHVGATIILAGVEAPARYSSSWPGVEFFTSGDEVPGTEFDDSKGLGKSGSSLAAPRVGALMAEIHRRHPEYSSVEVEKVVGEKFASGQSRLIGVEQVRDFNTLES